MGACRFSRAPARSGQLVRAWSLWMVAVALVVLGVVAVTDRAMRRNALAGAAIVVAVAALVSAPWYIHQATRYSVRSSIARRRTRSCSRGGRPASTWTRFPEVVRRPWQGALNDRFIPVLYAESWGDYFGIWAWGPGRSERTDAIDASLRRQSALGIPADGARPRRARSPARAFDHTPLPRIPRDSWPLFHRSQRSCPSSIWPLHIRRATETRSKARTRWPQSRRWHSASASRSTDSRDDAASASPSGRCWSFPLSQCFRSCSGERARDTPRDVAREALAPSRHRGRCLLAPRRGDWRNGASSPVGRADVP